MTLAAGACGGSAARSGDDAGSDARDAASHDAGEDVVDRPSPNPVDTAVPPSDALLPSQDVPADGPPVDTTSAMDTSASDASPVDTSSPADALVGPVGFDDLVVSGVGLESFEGKSFYLAIESSAGTFRGSTKVALGRFVVTLPRVFDRNTFGIFVLIYVDLNGDGHCTAADVGAWSVFADNAGGRGQPERVEFDPQRESPRQASDCRSFP